MGFPLAAVPVTRHRRIPGGSVDLPRYPIRRPRNNRRYGESSCLDADSSGLKARHFK